MSQRRGYLRLHVWAGNRDANDRTCQMSNIAGHSSSCPKCE